MPESRSYIVAQTREVKVFANSAADAVRIADAAFTNGQNSNSGVVDGLMGVWGNTTSRVRVVETWAKEDR